MLRLSLIGAISIVLIVMLSLVFSGGLHPNFSDGIFTKNNIKMYAVAFLSTVILQLIIEKLDI